ncbi:hypothetical protein IR073_01990 [Gemella sp. 19428wG2_WT2a]|nr:hypothetical protein [Gemella sp. 19428wG2_WT2a]TFU60231.1 hypothetical protein E4T67_01970 [Gemella sp. WT2a]
MNNFNRRLKKLKEKVSASKGSAIVFIEYDEENEKLTFNDELVSSEQDLYDKTRGYFKGYSNRVIIVDLIPQRFLPWIEKLEDLEND